jgi:N-succinyldiaminopimelate aminotransferase
LPVIRIFLACFLRVRAYGGAVQPLPVMAAATALWADDAHVVANRQLYREKFDLAAAALAGRAGFYRPPGGFFLWLDVGDGVAVAAELWRRHHVKTLPGAYLTAAVADGDPGARYLRVALVHEPALLAPALDALGSVLT